MAGSTNFPAALDNGTTLPQPGSGDFTNNPSHAGLHDNTALSIIATQTKLGTGTGASTSGTVLRGNGSGTSQWAQANLTTDVTGTLPVANGGTGIASLGSGVATFLGTPSSANLAAAVTDETGTGNLVFSSSPTIVTPTVASFVNATHDHTNSAGGGTLGSSALQTNAVQANQLATNAITLGSAQITTDITLTAPTSYTSTGLGKAVTIPSGSRQVKITVIIYNSFPSTAGGVPIYAIYKGAAVGTLTTLVQEFTGANISSGIIGTGLSIVGLDTPSAGALAYTFAAKISTGNLTLSATSHAGYILVENI